jgi:methyl-accepting chemotaxis protein
MDRTYRRRNYFIDRKFQASFILKFCGLVAAGGLATIAILYLVTRNTNTVAVMNSRVVVKTTADFLLPLLAQTVLVVMIMVGVASIAVTLFISHKIAGPLYRFRKVIEAIAEGDFSSDFRIRKKDQLQDLAAAMNGMMQKTRGELKSLESDASRLKDAMGRISEADVAEEKRSALKDIRKAAEELERAIRRFKF